ncbi:hypothetical protein FVR03_00945 [Pontibacter qinzhouensis]|uniref:Uncharacterized protein n=1 Tax=Pontibacter qinzhouensis TaxID=2603253 RepID=A0A5C8KFJ6_9BACT|nr:hypothetical protein [Pontibacter qinzhouensis]TXK52656.1 hypothetical protein FVR03_00945 [Pontibacter qinzhouensis]
MKEIMDNIKTVCALICLFFPVVLWSCDAEKADTPAPLATLEQADHVKGGPNRPNSAYHNKVLAQVRQATAKYHRIEAAIADGYMASSDCVASPAGGMGYHFVNFMLVDGIVDPMHPEVLVYEPQKNGKLKLVAIEFMVMAASWDPLYATPPMLGDQVYDDHRAPGSGGPPFPHYQLHAWVWKNNPSGMHAPFNPKVSCQYATE